VENSKTFRSGLRAHEVSNWRDLGTEVRSFSSSNAVHVLGTFSESISDFEDVKVYAQRTRRPATLKGVVRETITPRDVSPNPNELAPSDVNHKTPQTLSMTSELTVYCTPQRTSQPPGSPPANLATNSGCHLANKTRIHAYCQARLIHTQRNQRTNLPFEFYQQ
jgi:hypothetical protein